jgi:hypothetical protein
MLDTLYKPSFQDFIDGRTYCPPGQDESLNTPISDALLNAWSWYARDNIPTMYGWDVRNFAWDIRRRAMNEDVGKQYLGDLCEAWQDDFDLDAIWDAADRDEVEADELVMHALCSLHHSGELHSIDDDGSLAEELNTLAARFDSLNLEAYQNSTSLEAKADRGIVGYEFEIGRRILEQRKERSMSNVMRLRASQPDEQPKPPPRYLFETVNDLRSMPAAKWLVDKWIPEQGVGLIYGEYGSGKSFIAFDQLLHLVYGLPEWHGIKLTGVPCEALLVAREGAKGFISRIDAFKKHHNITDDTDRIVFMRSPVNFGEVRGFEELKTAISATGKQFRMVMVDTVGRALPGEDMYDPKSITRFMEHLQQVGEIGGGVAIGVHHENKGGDLFGSVYFGASSDFMFRVEREGSAEKGDPLRRGKITCTKMKDGADGWSKNVTYRLVEAQEGGEGSLVVESLGDASKEVAGRKLTKHDKLAFRALSEALREVGKLRPEMSGRTVTVDEWLNQCFKIGAVQPDAAKPKRDLHNRQVSLLNERMILVQDELVRIIDQGAITNVVIPMMNGLPPIPQRRD